MYFNRPERSWYNSTISAEFRYVLTITIKICYVSTISSKIMYVLTLLTKLMYVLTNSTAFRNVSTLSNKSLACFACFGHSFGMFWLTRPTSDMFGPYWPKSGHFEHLDRIQVYFDCLDQKFLCFDHLRQIQFNIDLPTEIWNVPTNSTNFS